MFINLVLIIAFYYIGLRFPDIDFKIKGLRHRSIVTHSFLLPLVLFIFHKTEMLTLIWMKTYDITGSVITGLCFGMTVHFLYDLFPKRFVGSALIQLPVGNSYKNKYALSPVNTVMLFILSSLMQTFISLYYLSEFNEIIVLVICTAMTLFFKRKSENGFYLVIFLFVGIIFVSFYFREYFIIYVNDFMKVRHI